MNKLKYLLSAFVLLCFASCKDDPWEDVADGGWNHERSIIDVKFEGQAGTPTITETDSETGVIELQLASDMVADMSKVRVETLTLSYKATANVASGGTIDFTKGDPQIVVTSPNGESRTYTLEMTEFTETLTGTYTISNLWVYGGTGAAYDCTKLYKPADKSWCWNGEGRGPAAEMDNYLVFTLGEILADGNTTGTCMNWAGEDAKNWDCVFAGAPNPAFVNPVDKSWVWDDSIGKESDNILAMTATGTDDAGRETGECEYLPGEDGGYWNYILKADYNKEGTGALDLTKYYGLLPHGKSAYVYDAEAGTVVFTSGIVSITAKLLREGDYSYGSSTLSVPGIAFDFALPGQTTQGAYPWTDYDRFAVGPRNYVMLFNKQAEAGE